VVFSPLGTNILVRIQLGQALFEGDSFMKSIGVGKRRKNALVLCTSASLLFSCTGTSDTLNSNDSTTLAAEIAKVSNDKSTKQLAKESTKDRSELLKTQANASDAKDKSLIATSDVLNKQTILECKKCASKLDLLQGENIDRIVISKTSESGIPSVQLNAKDNQVVLELPKQVAWSQVSKEIEGKIVRSATLTDKQTIIIDVANASNIKVDAETVKDTFVLCISDKNYSTKTTPQALVALLEKQGSSGLTKQPAARLSSLSIDENGAGSIKAKLSSPVDFKLEKTAPSEFVLRLVGVTEGEGVTETLLASNADLAIKSARSTRENTDTIIRIFVKPEVDLDAQSDESGNVLVRALPLGAELDIRAQFNPEATPVANATKVPSGEVKSKSPVIKSDATGKVETQQVGSPAKPSTPVRTFAGSGDELDAYSGKLISLDLQETDIENALRIIAEVSNLNIITTDAVTGKVTMRLIDVPWDQALDVILKTNGLDQVREGNVVRIAPIDQLKAERLALKEAQQAEEQLEELKLRFVRVSYSKAAELKPLLESVITERGIVSYDERTNQLIVKDIDKGLENVNQLVAKLDLRTPQVLLETQIVEANRTLLRDLGNEFGFSFVQSPQTGNATGSNFPNSVQFGGSFRNPAAATTNSISLLLGSADGSKSLTQIITALENEGTVRIVSKPAVATLNNKPALIKSIEKVRIRLPQGGVSVATGAGANAQGQGNVATEIIEVGIVLEVTPQASPDYYVLLDINAKSSTLGTNSVDGIPSEIERSARSSVLISSGQTFALGGIYKISDNTNLGGLPFFKDIPVVGSLFRRSNTDNRDEELLFFVTPRIVEGSFDDATMSPAA
jgi:type IV pilus secretin PilQ/predicted competence protein